MNEDSKKDGVLLVDKPYGYTSQKILNIVKQKFILKKAGHTGTLDPLATGLLVCVFGDYTKYISFFVNQTKTYIVEVLIGIETNTLDMEGIDRNLLKISHNISEKDIKKVLKKFKGYISQIPPRYSALKYLGKPRYYYERKGLIIPEPPRRVVEIFDISEFSYRDNSIFSFKVVCSSGTYIRSLVRDIGNELNTPMTVLNIRRVSIGNFSIDKALHINVNNNEFKEDNYLDYVLGAEQLLYNIKQRCFLKKEQIEDISLGREIILHYPIKDSKYTIAISEEDNRFLGILVNVFENNWRAYRWSHEESLKAQRLKTL